MSAAPVEPCPCDCERCHREGYAEGVEDAAKVCESVLNDPALSIVVTREETTTLKRVVKAVRALAPRP